MSCNVAWWGSVSDELQLSTIKGLLVPCKPREPGKNNGMILGNWSFGCLYHVWLKSSFALQHERAPQQNFGLRSFDMKEQTRRRKWLQLTTFVWSSYCEVSIRIFGMFVVQCAKSNRRSYSTSSVEKVKASHKPSKTIFNCTRTVISNLYKALIRCVCAVVRGRLPSPQTFGPSNYSWPIQHTAYHVLLVLRHFDILKCWRALVENFWTW